MTNFIAKTVKQIKAGEVIPEYTKWCKNNSNCLYKDKKRKFHGWINLTELKKKNGVAQCGWDDGDCSHTTHYGIGGYHNICPIAGINGDYVWPAKLQFSNFSFSSNGITSASIIKSVKISFEHRMVAIDVKTGKQYDNFGPTFHSKDSWGAKLYFTKGSSIVSEIKKHSSNPKLSKKNFSSVSYTFKDIKISDLLDANFAFNIEYNHNYNTTPGAIYIKNVVIEVDHQNGELFIEGSSDKETLLMKRFSTSTCSTTITHTIKAGYKDKNKIISPNNAPEKLGSKIQCIEKPDNVNVEEKASNDGQKVFLITDNSEEEGKKRIVYNLSNHPSKKVVLEYQANLEPKPKYQIITNYKSGEDFDQKINYITLKDGCCNGLKIYIDSMDSTPLTLSVDNNNKKTNLLNISEIESFHNRIKNLSCGIHTLYIQRLPETPQDAQNNKVIIKVSSMNFKFKIWADKEDPEKLEFLQKKSTNTSQISESIFIQRIDNEPKEVIPKINIIDETKMGEVTSVTSVHKNDIINYEIHKNYAGKFYLKIEDDGICKKTHTKAEILITDTHKQNYDYLFTKVEGGTELNIDYLVAWETDNNKEPLEIESAILRNSENDIRICSNSAQSGLSQIGTIDLIVKNKSNETIEGVEIELNALIENDDQEKEVTTKEWTDVDGIFNQFYTLFYEYNAELNNTVQIKNLTADNDLVDEENVTLVINKIEPQSIIKMILPFRSITEKTVYLQYLLFEDPLPINTISQCDNESLSENNEIKIDVFDSMLTNLEISGNTDLLILDQSFDCPDECYTTKDVDNNYIPINDNNSGGITYKITNTDTNNFDNNTVATKIINSNELIPYAYISEGEIYEFFDSNGERQSIQENRPLTDISGEPIRDGTGNIMYKPNKLEWVYEEEEILNFMAWQNITCSVQFPNCNETTYNIRTDKNGYAHFFIPIPTSITTSYNITELLQQVLIFSIKEQKDYNAAVLTKNTDYILDPINPDKNEVIIDFVETYRRFKPGEVAHIVITVQSKTKAIRNYFKFNAILNDIGSSDEVTILYKICNLANNEGVLTTTFKTDDKKLIPNQISEDIYAGVSTNLHVYSKLNKRIIESTNLNILYLEIENDKKNNKDVEIQISLGKIPPYYLGDYDLIDINIETGDYSIIEDGDNVYINWLIGEMSAFEKQQGVIKIKATDIGLSEIDIQTFDYLHKPNASNIIVKQSKCEKCTENNKWRFADSPWKKIDGIWYKLFEDGKYKRRINNKWVDKE